MNSIQFLSKILTISVIFLQYSTAQQFEPRIAIRKDGLVGFVDTTGTIVIAPRFDYSSGFSGGLAAVELGAEYYFTPFDTSIAPFKVSASEVDSFSRLNGNLKKTGGKFGFINTDGQFVIPPLYDEVNEFSEGLAAANVGGWIGDDGGLEGGKWGFIDITGDTIVDFDFNYVQKFSEGLAYVSKGFDESGFIDRSGKVVIPFAAQIVNDFKDGYATFENPYDYGYIDRAGNKYPGPLHISEGIELIKHKDKYGLGDTLGNVIIEPKFEFIDFFRGGVARAKIRDKWGFIKKDGTFLCQPAYDFVYDFADGVARIQLGGKLGYIDGACNIVVAPRFDKAEDFHEGLAWVMIKGENSGYINKAGTFVWTDSEE